jgi:hypothetical protein
MKERMKSAERFANPIGNLFQNFNVNVQHRSESNKKAEPILKFLLSFQCDDPRQFNFRNAPIRGTILFLE